MSILPSRLPQTLGMFPNMITLAIYSVVAVALFAAGFYAGLKNAGSKKVEKSIDLIKALKSKD